MIANSFKSCALNIPVDSSEDGEIHCFTDGQPCQKGFDMLKNRLTVLTEPERNPFSVEGEATPFFLIIDEDSDEDVDI